MLLGIYLHAAVAYAPYGGWPWKEPGAQTAVYGLSVGIIHNFRMPLFYAMSGFFAALLIDRKGAREFVYNRAKRILLPFAAGWCLLYPAVTALACYGMNWRRPDAAAAVWTFLKSGEFLKYLHPLHLWFLEYLLIFYPVCLAAVCLVRRAPFGLRNGLNALFRAAVRCPAAPLIFALPTFFTLCAMQGTLTYDDPPSFVPQPRIIFAYLVFVGFGWLLYVNRDLLDGVRRRVWWNLVQLAVLVVFCCFVLSVSPQAGRDCRYYTVLAGYGAGTWFFVFGLTGLCLRYLADPSPALRYLSDSSYWLYLAHMPVLLVVQLALARVNWPPALKAPLALAAALPVLFLSYQFLVRPTVIGRVLNGRRYPLRTPARGLVQASATS